MRSNNKSREEIQSDLRNDSIVGMKVRKISSIFCLAAVLKKGHIAMVGRGSVEDAYSPSFSIREGGSGRKTRSKDA